LQMTAPSRNMPPAPVHKASRLVWLFLALLIAGLAYWFSEEPYFVGVLGAVLGVIVWIQSIWDTRSRRRLATSRQEESICEFARSFNRETDAWLIRAVYEELSRYLSVDGRPIPVRQQDHCEKDLGIDPEDLDDIARDAAFRGALWMAATRIHCTARCRPSVTSLGFLSINHESSNQALHRMTVPPRSLAIRESRRGRHR